MLNYYYYYNIVDIDVILYFFQKDFANSLVVPQSDKSMSRRYQKKERSKSSEVRDNVAYGLNGFVSSKVTTENSTSSEVSMDIPQATFMHIPFSTHTKFSQDDYYFFGTYNFSIRITFNTIWKIRSFLCISIVILYYIKELLTSAGTLLGIKNVCAETRMYVIHC